MKSKLFLVLFLGVFATSLAHAQEAGDMPIGDFLASILNFIKEFKNLAVQMKIAGVLTILLSTLKVSALRQYTWDKIGSAKVLVAPALALIVGCLTIKDLNVQSAFNYMVSVGGGAIVLHQLLDALKSALEKSPVAVAIIGFIDGLIPRALKAE